MFVKLLHGLQSCLNKFFQLWTNKDIPAEYTQIKHDFKDGLGNVPAIPVDEIGFDVNLVEKKDLPKMQQVTELCSFDVNLINKKDLPKMEEIKKDTCSFDVSLVSVIEIE